MRRAICVSSLVCLLISTATWGAAKQATTPGSFLKYRANSAAELATMVRQDPALAARYSKHFGATEAGVADFFQHQLKLVRLRQSKTAMVYMVASNGQIVTHKRVFPSGTLVFATPDGQPVLDWRCGNPLASSLPLSRARAAAKEQAATAPATEPAKQVASLPDSQDVVEKILDQPPAELAAPVLQQAALTPPMAPVMVAGLPPVIEATAIPAVSAMESIPAIAQAGRGFGWLLPLAALGGAAGGLGGGGGSEAPVDPVLPVPEPAAMLGLASGALGAGLGAGRMRKHARK